MSAFKFKTIILDDIEYKLVPKDMNFYFTIEELSKRTKFAVATLYKLKAKLTEGLHYSKPNGGKILFSDKAVDFLTQGKHNENKQRDCIQEKRQPVSLSEFFDQR
jgi:hypothetical protein